MPANNGWSEKVSFIWSVKEILRDHYKRHQYGAIILPLCVVRRLDCVLEPSKAKVVERAKKIKGDVDAHFDLLCSIAEQQFYNTSPFSFDTLLDDTDNIAANFIAYLNGFSPNVRDVIAKFDLLPQVDRLETAGILGPVLAQFKMIDLHPDVASNIEMGYIYEELIRVTADLSNEEAGEHFTPREVIRLMANILLTDERSLHIPSKIFKVLDPAFMRNFDVSRDTLRQLLTWLHERTTRMGLTPAVNGCCTSATCDLHSNSAGSNARARR